MLLLPTICVTYALCSHWKPYADYLNTSMYYKIDPKHFQTRNLNCYQKFYLTLILNSEKINVVTFGAVMTIFNNKNF